VTLSSPQVARFLGVAGDRDISIIAVLAERLEGLGAAAWPAAAVAAAPVALIQLNVRPLLRLRGMSALDTASCE
jgi:hypothetical protein